MLKCCILKVYIVKKRKDGRINESISDSGRRYSIYLNKHWFDKERDQ